MASLNNANRIYFANYQVGMKRQCLVDFDDGTPTGNPNDPPNYDFTAGVGGGPGSVPNDEYLIDGLQSVASNTTFNNREVFQICQSEIYENVEDIPDVEVTLNKVLDGCCLLFHHATGDATEPTLQGRANASVSLAISIFDDTVASTGFGGSTPNSTVVYPDMFVNSVNYTFNVENDFTEEITLVGNDRLWWIDPVFATNNPDQIPCAGDPCNAPVGNYCADYINAVCAINFPGACPTNDGIPCACPPNESGVQNTKDFILPNDTDLADPNPLPQDDNGAWCVSDVTILPTEIPGVDCFGRVNTACIQNITTSVDLNREEFRCLGSRQVKFRAVDFPVEVTTEIELFGTIGDLIPHTANGVYDCDLCADPAGRCESVGTNLVNNTIRIATCGGLRIYTGTKNKLQSVNVTGGDAGGDNVTITYSYRTFNTFTVMHERDCNPNGNGTGLDFWGNRDTYLTECV